ncbi:MAG: S8 family serine peptidase [Promethearchaeota archaeon]
MKTILTIKKISLSLVLLVVLISLASSNTLGNIAADMQTAVSGSASPTAERSSNPLFSNPLSRDKPLTDRLSTLKKGTEMSLENENGIVSLQAVYEQAGISITDQVQGVLVKVEEDSIRLIIGFHKSYQLTSELYNEHFITSDGVLHRELDRLNAIVVNVPISSLRSFMEYWKVLPTVRYVEVAQVTQVSAVPNDPDWSLQYGPQIIQANLAWDIQMGDPASILVAVIDTGIDYTHPDLVDQYVPLGYDWVFGDDDPMDDHSHGTHCAGIIGATINNSLGIAGVANVSIMAEKVFDSSGWGYDYDAADAIVHATNMGATVLSNSYGFPEPSTALEDAVAYAYANDVVIVVSAGNDEQLVSRYPASYPETITVSATDSYDDPAWFTNYGPLIDVAAPGVQVWSTIPMGSYGYMDGTSMSCPHVAGICALIRAEFPFWSNEFVRAHLRNSADDLGPPGRDDYYGYGRVNAYQAVQPPPEHELIAYLDAPTVSPVGNSRDLNVKVGNWGQYEEWDVILQLWIDDVMVDSRAYPSLLVGTTETFIYTWTPSIEGMYNITAYALPVPGESNQYNNNYTTMTTVINLQNYEMVVGAPYTWYDAYANGFNLGLMGDDVSTAIEFPFLFHYYDTIFDSVYVSSNGWLSFYSTDPWQYWNPLFPTSDYPYAIAPFWADLYADDNVYVWTTAEFVVIEYYDYYHLGGDLAGTFEVVFFATGDILFQYQSITTDYGATVGLNYGLFTDFYNTYTDGLGGVTDFTLLFTTNYDAHDVVAILEAPIDVLIGTSVLLNATAANTGTYDETNVQLQLWIDDTLVDSAIYPSLPVLATETLSYLWTPTTEGTYNITAYVFPVIDEFTISNNQATVMTYVGEPILEFELGDYAQLEYTYSTPMWMRFTYNEYIDPAIVDVTLEAAGSPAWVTVNTLTRLCVDGVWAGVGQDIYYPYQIETSINLGDTINWFTGTGYVDGTAWYDWDGTPLEAWVIRLDDYYPGSYGYFHKETGLLLYMWDTGAAMDVFMTETNMINFVPTVTITYPNGGETLSGSATITWMASDPEDDPLTFTIYYWDGGSWVEITSGLDVLSYDWDTTTVPDGSTYKIRVVASDGALTGEDESDAVFTIENPDPPTVTVISPNGGEALSNTVTITWTASDPDGDTLTFTVYYWDGSTWFELASDLTDTSYEWDTTSVSDGSSCKIRIGASDGTFTTEDESNTFTINNPDPPTVTVTTPNGGEALSGSVIIKWMAEDPDDDPLTFTVYYGDGSNWILLASDLTDTQYEWDTSGLKGGGFYIRVVASDGTFTVEDRSDDEFSIVNITPGFEAILTILIILSLGLTAILRKRFRTKQ